MNAFSSGLGPLWQLGAFLVALGILVIVHELGHFLVARWCGVKVLRFAVGFGKPLLIWRWGKDRTEWALAAIPLGGYVKMLDEREAPVAAADAPRAFNRLPVSRRMLVVAAGPAANLLLAIFLYWVVFQVGVTELRPYLSAPPADSVAAHAGIAAGDRVLRVQGEEIASWSDLRLALVDAALAGQSVELQTQSADGNLATRFLDLGANAADRLDGDLSRHLGLAPYAPPRRPVVGSVLEGSPAMLAGLQAGDEIQSIDGRPIGFWADLVEVISSAPGQRLSMRILRAGNSLDVTIVPSAVTGSGRTIGRIGAAVRVDPELDKLFRVDVSYGSIDAAARAVKKAWETARLTLVVMGRMVVGEMSVRNLSGPIAIADYAGQSAQLGAVSFMNFLALISVSLGILNLLPIPILDGGHLMYYLAEFLKGSPVSERMQEMGQRIGFVILGLLMACALYNDFNRLLSS